MKYSALDKLNLLANIYSRMFAAIFKFRTWLGFFILALFQAFGLFMLARFYLPGFYQITNPILSMFVPGFMFHYPQYYLALPSIYSGYENFILGPTVWVILSAFAVYRLGGYYSDNKPTAGESFSIARKVYIPLLVFWALETGLVLLVMFLSTSIADDFVFGSPNRKIVLNLGLQFLAFGISAFFLYTIPGVILGSKKLLTAIRESIGLCRKNFFLTFFIILIPGSIKTFINLLLTEFSPKIVKFLNPELILLLLGIQIFMGIFINLFIYGSAVFVYKKMS
ncbi:MAG: hypothetical protein V3W18_09165 [candidate division Zixibacteria bacterium]